MSWRHACVLLESQSSLGSFVTPMPETAQEGEPPEAQADWGLTEVAVVSSGCFRDTRGQRSCSETA